ncbi:MAG: Rne/Rng family ribonuclease [Rhizobiaceae bacterium]
MANNKMLIDAAHPEETRVAMVRGNRVDEFDFESEHKTQLRGNIYLAKVTRVEPSLQAAFVDYGGNRHGFLAFAEIHPDYYQIPVADRQALIDADAEDARNAAAAENADDNEDSDENGDDEEKAEAKPTRKRRSRRRGTKKTSDSNDEPETSDEKETSKDAASSDANEQPTEEDDSDDTVMAADNENDDVVSEDAPKKPRRRTSRVKKTVEASEKPAEEEAPKKKPRKTARKKKEPEALAEEAPAETVTAEAEEAPKTTRRRTSRKKKDTEEAAVEASPETESEAEDKPKPTRRRSTRKKKDAEEEAQATETDSEVTSSEEDPSEEAENKGRKPRSRSRSRRGKKKPDSSENNDNDSVENLGSADAMEEVPARRSNRRHYKIQEVIKRRQILLVQVVKEERGNKGAALTTYLSLAGRYSVLMPNTARGGGISRKITNSSDRKRLKSIASGLEVPQGMGVILRTAGASRGSDEIQRDFEYLMRLWENVRTLTLDSTAPCLVYEEGSLIKRSIRDLYDKDTGEILVAGEAGFKEAKDFMTMLMPSHAKNVKLYRDHIPLFARMGVEAQLDAMLQPQVTLKSGGYLILDQTEALVAIDVNSGRSTRQHSIEDTAVATNLEAADEVARQLRLRDLAGLIVIDFIDMEDKRNVRAVEKRLKDALKNDRARIQVGRISHFGLMEMSRQRIRASVLESTTQTCPTCDGLGHVRSSSSVVLGVLRAIEEHLNRNSRNNLTVKVSTATAIYLLNSKRETLSDLENRFGVSLLIEPDDTLGTTPCTIEKGELSNRKPVQPTAVQADMAMDETEPTETVSEPRTEDAESANSEGDGRKKRRRRRRRRGSSSEEGQEANSSEEEAGSDSQAASEAVGEKPKEPSTEAEADEKPRKRTRRSKKSTDDAVSEDEVATTEEKEEKPKRTRRKKAVKPEVEATAEAIPSDDDEDSKPRRRTTRRKTAAEVEPAETTATEEAPATEEADGDKSKKRGGWWQRKFF